MSDLIDRVGEFEESGLVAMARAGERGAWFLGHIGAAILAGVRVLRSEPVSGAVRIAVSAELQRLRDDPANAEWFEAPPGRYAGRDTSAILDVLEDSASTLRTSGHPTIYLTTALLALRGRPDLATAWTIDGLCALHESASLDRRDRYYGIDDYFAVADRDDTIETPDWSGAIRTLVSRLAHVLPDHIPGQERYFFVGEKIHLLTQLRAADGLEELGRADLASRALRAFALHAQLVERSEMLPPTEIVRSPLDPSAPEFWACRPPDPWHVLKVGEAYLHLSSQRVGEDRGALDERMARVWTLLGVA